jgi:uncharacterized membrane protein YpjA
MVSWLYAVLMNKKSLMLIFTINLLGTIYGYIWYIPQLEVTKSYFIPFVPDSPTASLFFCFVLLGFIVRKNWGLFEALAIMALFKYGIWAVVMNLLTLKVTGYLPWEGYMLMMSHGAMAMEGLLFSPFYNMKKWHLILAGIFILHNDMIDYVFMQYPVYSQLEQFINQIGYFTFWLSVLSIGIALFVSKESKWMRKYYLI